MQDLMALCSLKITAGGNSLDIL